MTLKNKLILITILFLISLTIIIILLKQPVSNNISNNETQSNSLEPISENNIQNIQEYSNSNPENSKISLILYYGEGCPHCAIVENYLKSNPPKFNIEKKEVYYNKNNQNDLMAKAKICGMPLNQIGVPFLWNGEECILGDEPIINYFKNLTNSL